MARIKKTIRDEYIVVHHVHGEEDVLDFLRMTSRTILNRLCYDAKNHGRSEFRYRNTTYQMAHDTDGTFLIEAMEDSAAEAW